MSSLPLCYESSYFTVAPKSTEHPFFPMTNDKDQVFMYFSNSFYAIHSHLAKVIILQQH